MEQRKVMSLGRSSLVISLPRHWVKLNELKQGDVVSVGVQRDRSLVVFPGAERKKEVREITLDIDSSEKETSIVRRIIACYLNGYSSIKLASNKIFSSAQQRAIREMAGKIYMRIMESDAKNMHLITLIDESKASFVSGIHRMHMISSSICRDAFNSLKNQDVDLARTTYYLDDDVDNFCFFLLRLLRSAANDPALANQLELDPIDCLDYQALVHRIEHTADNATNIVKHVIMLEGRQQKIPDSLLKLMLISGNEAFEAYDKAVKSFLSKDIVNCNEIMDYQEKIEKLDREIASLAFLTEGMNAMTVCAVCSIRDNIKRIAEFAADIAEVTINRFYEEKSYTYALSEDISKLT